MIRLVVSAAANLLVWPVRAGNFVAAPFVRLWRLARLRAYAAGDIPVTTQFDGCIHTTGRVRLSLGGHCRLGRDVFFETSDAGMIELGANVRVNRGSMLVSYAHVHIGPDCLIGEYVSLRDADHGIAPGTPMRLQPHSAAPITVGRDVWIARGACILKGVTIGDGAVIGANAVVTSNVPARAIAVGVPARVLRYRASGGAPSPDEVAELIEATAAS